MPVILQPVAAAFRCHPARQFAVLKQETDIAVGPGRIAVSKAEGHGTVKNADQVIVGVERKAHAPDVVLNSPPGLISRSLISLPLSLLSTGMVLGARVNDMMMKRTFEVFQAAAHPSQDHPAAGILHATAAAEK